VPEIVGGAVFLGAELDVAGATTAVWADSAVAEPSALVAVTRTRIVFPESAPTSVYVLCVPFETFTHELPPALQRTHWYANEVGVLLHVPFPAVRV
jgi:hypothetical protein